MQQIQHLIKESLQQMQGPDCKNKLFNSFSGDQDYDKECQLCMTEFTQTNHPMRICVNGHNLCQKCVQLNLFFQKATSQQAHQKDRYCPFCKARINQRKISVNYKLLNSLKKTNKQNKTILEPQNIFLSKNGIYLLERLSQQNYRLIMSFVSQNDKMKLASTNLFLRSLLMTDQIWGEFEISDCLSMISFSGTIEKNWNLRLRWIEKYFSVIKPHEVKMVIRDFCNDENLLYFFLDKYYWVEKLTLVCESTDIHLAVAKACTEVNFLSVSSNIFSDELFELMTKKMTKIKHFQVIKDDANFTAKNISKYLPEGLESILLKPHMIEFEQIAILAQKNPQKLTYIELDIEDCSEQTLIQILEPLTNVEVLKLFHMENIHIPQKLSESLSSNVRQLYFTKAYQMPLESIIQKIASPKLLTIDFTQVNLLDDRNIESIAKGCPYLRRLNISWCTKVTEESVAGLIRSCLSLQYLNLTGIKCVTDKVFQEYFVLASFFIEDNFDEVKHQILSAMQQGQNIESLNYETIQFIREERKQEAIEKIGSIKSLRNLKQLNCVSCNGVSDAILKIIYLVNRKANTINYYGNCMGLYTNQDMFGSM